MDLEAIVPNGPAAVRCSPLRDRTIRTINVSAESPYESIGAKIPGFQRRQHRECIISAQISVECREALTLRFQEEMTLEEIATVTGAPMGTVKSRVYRGLAALQPWLKGAR